MVLTTDIVIYKQLRERKKEIIKNITDVIMPLLMPIFTKQLNIEEKNAKKKTAQ